MNWLDKAVGWISPEAGVRRMRARTALSAARAYDAAKIGRRTTNWVATGSSANAELYGSLSRLMYRSRDLVRNNPYARRAIAALVSNTVGTGIRVSVKGAPGTVWAAWCREADFYRELDLYGLQALVARATFESGECLIVRQRARASEVGPSGVPLQVKVLEADYIATIKHGVLENGNQAVAGVEIDKEGRIVAYWLYARHPGETAILQPYLYPERVLAEDVIHVFEKDRPGQLRGVPRLASSIMRLRDLDDYQEALLVKKKIEACFAAFVTTSEENRTIGNVVSTESPDDNGNSRRVERLSPGMIEYLKDGESVTFGSTNSSAGDGYSNSQLHAIAIGAGLTYEQLTGDLSNVNFSSMRAGRQEFKALVEQFRWLTFIPMVCERLWSWFEEAAYLSNRVRTRGYEHSWTPPRWEYVNPLDDVRTDKEELAAGLATLSEKIRARGDDPDDVFAEMAKERDTLKKLGITVDYGIKGSGAGDVTGAPAANPEPAASPGGDQTKVFPLEPRRVRGFSLSEVEMTHVVQREMGDLEMQLRFAPISSVNKEQRTADLVWTTGAGVRRYDWMRDRYYMEELSLDPGAVRMGRLQSGSAPLLDSHDRYGGIRAQLGVVTAASLAVGQGVATVRFSKREEVTPIFDDVADGIVRNVSVGYIVNRYEMLPPTDGSEVWTYRATDWEPLELSLVSIGADMGAGIRSAKPGKEAETFKCEFIPAAAADSSSTRKEHSMDDKSKQGGAPAAEANAGKTEEQVRQATEAAAKAERERISEIQTRAKAAGLDEAFVKPYVDGGKSVDEFCRSVVDEIAKKSDAARKLNGRDTSGAGSRTDVEIVQDERIKLRTAVSAALVHRIDPKAKGELPAGAGEFRYMSLLRVAEEVLTRENVRTRGMSSMEIAARALQSTSDFANILLDAFNKRLRQQYIENEPSYTVWARRAPNAPDFKTINVIKMSNSPDLQQVLEGGEFQRGSLSDGKETYQVVTYGRIIPVSRQAIINDDMNAFDRLPRILAGAARRLENRTVYGVLVSNANMSDGNAVFGAGHTNLATGAGSALQASSMITARAGIRTQKGNQNEELNLAPTWLIVPAALEQTAYQLTSNQYTPTKPADINEFRTGGRTSVTPVVEAYLDGQAGGTTKWWLAADNGQIDTVEYCFLDGNEGLYLENHIGFDVDGIEMKARLDFAATAIDYRGMYQSNGT